MKYFYLVAFGLVAVWNFLTVFQMLDTVLWPLGLLALVVGVACVWQFCMTIEQIQRDRDHHDS